MLTPAVLSIDLLKHIDNHFRNTIYKHHRTPLLDYTPEAVVIFAVVIFDRILRPSGLAPNTTQVGYINYLTKTYREAMGTITPVLEGFIGELETIIVEPQYKDAELQPHSIGEYIKYFKTGEDTEDGYNAKHYPALHDFFSITSPLLTFPYVNDRRINDLKYEADKLQRRHSERLVIFIREELLTLTDQLKDLKAMPVDATPENRDGYGLPPDIEVILEQFLALASAKAQSEAETQAQAQDDAHIREAQARIQAEAQARQAKQEPRTLTPEEYLELFISTLEPHYTSLASKYTSLHRENSNIARLDDMHAYILATKYAKSHNLDLNTVLAQQTQAQSTILNFDNLKPILSTCLQCYLYNLAIDDVLAHKVVAHGVVQGILEATKRYAPDIARRGYRSNVDLAEALYNKILSNTDGFATALPLPEVEPQTAEAMKLRAKELTHRESVPKGEILPFDLTKPLAQVIHGMRADTITAFTDILSVNPDPSSLTPVNIKTIKDVAYLLIGRACTPYLVDGELVIHDETDNKYYKIISNIDKDNYAAYGFRVCNFQNLSSRIYRQQNLLMTSSKYKDRFFYNDENHSDPYDDPFNEPSKKSKTVSDEDLGHIKYKPLPQGDPQARQKVLVDLEAWDKVLTNRINDTFDDPDYYEAHAKAQEQYREINAIQYFHPSIIFISAHKLAAYVYFPQEYSDLIIRKPLDPETGKPLVYHPHHKDGNRSNNRKDNLEIISKQLNDELRYTSRPVIYQGKHYNTLKSYCDMTDAGSRTKLTERLSALTSDTEVVEFNGRLYTIDNKTSIIIAADNEEATVIAYGDTEYPDLKAFAKAHKLNYGTIQKGIKRAKDAGKPMYKHYKYRFYLDPLGDITIKTD